MLQNIPKTLTDLQLTIETLKYESISLKRDVEQKKREIKKLQALVKNLNRTPSAVSLNVCGSAPADTVEGLREQMRILEEALRYQAAEMELMKQNQHEVRLPSCIYQGSASIHFGL